MPPKVAPKDYCMTPQAMHEVYMNLAQGFMKQMEREGLPKSAKQVDNEFFAIHYYGTDGQLRAPTFYFLNEVKKDYLSTLYGSLFPMGQRRFRLHVDANVLIDLQAEEPFSSPVFFYDLTFEEIFKGKNVEEIIKIYSDNNCGQTSLWRVYREASGEAIDLLKSVGAPWFKGGIKVYEEVTYEQLSEESKQQPEAPQ